MDTELNDQLAEELNDDMKSSLLPVTIFVGAEALFGFCGNVLVLFVFSFHYHKCNFKYFVLCLALVDLVSTLTTIPGEILTHRFWYVYPFPIVCRIKSFFNMFTVMASAFTLLVIAVDRYRKICQPFGWQVKPKMALILCAVQLAIAFIIAFPVAFLWGTQFNYITYKNQTINVTHCEKAEEFRFTKIHITYTAATETIGGIVLIIMFVLYIFVCRKLFTNSKPGAISSPGGNNRSEPESDTMLSRGATSDDDNTTQRSVTAMTDASDLVALEDKQKEFEPESNLQALYPSLLMKKTTPENNYLPANANKAENTGKASGGKLARRLQRKTMIMFILTAVFIFTTILYMTLLIFIAHDVLQALSNSQKAVYFFFFRLYFINHVINPILYGILDLHFRRILKRVFKSIIND